MALGILGIIFIVSLLLGAACLFLLLFKGGRYTENRIAFIGIEAYTALLAFLYITAAPSNDLGSKVLGCILLALSIGVFFIKEKVNLWARLLLTILIIVLNYLLFLA